MTFRLDRSQEKRLLKAYRAPKVELILKEAGKKGAREARMVMSSQAPIGTTEHPSQYYRTHGLSHGTFRRTVKSAYIRGRHSFVKGLQGKTIGYVIGPMGKHAFTRHWIEHGTRRQRANPWVERVAGSAFSVAQRASQRVLEAYARARH